LLSPFWRGRRTRKEEEFAAGIPWWRGHTIAGWQR
jgi:hypothetical protein